MTPHIESKKDQIAPIVLMPGDPLRARYIAQKYLKDAKLVNQVRNMLAYTGYYKNKKVTVFASGMGIPSMGIYAYELFNFYDVKKIIRIGSCGTFNKNIKVGDLLLATSARSISYYDDLMLEHNINEKTSSKELNNLIIKTASDLNIPLKEGKIITSDVFDHYVDFNNFLTLHGEDNYLGTEMEAFGLFIVASKFNRQASCLLTVVDSHNSDDIIDPKDREKSLDDMIILALESIIKD